MIDQITLNPKDFSVEVLKEATRGGPDSIRPQLAVVLLKAKLGPGAESYLAACASDEGLDVRVWGLAIEELAQFSGAKERLKALTEIGESIRAGSSVSGTGGAVAKILRPAVQPVMNSAVSQ